MATWSHRPKPTLVESSPSSGRSGVCMSRSSSQWEKLASATSPKPSGLRAAGNTAATMAANTTDRIRAPNRPWEYGM